MDRYTSKAREAINAAVEEAAELGHDAVGTEHLLLGLLDVSSGMAAKVLEAHGVTRDGVLKLMNQYMAPANNVNMKEPSGYTPKANRVLEASYREARSAGQALIGTEHLLVAMLKESDCGGTRLLNTLGADIRRMYVDLYTGAGQDPDQIRDSLRQNMPQGKGRTKTPTLDQYGRDLTALAKEGGIDPVIGRTAEIERVVQILSRRTKNNPCLIGEPGVGKTAIAEGLATRISEGNIPETIADKRLVTLDLSGMVAGSKYRGEFEERIKNVIREVSEAGDVLLFIDELHTIIGAGGAEGALDAANIIKPALARGEIQIIGATTIEEYRKHIEKDAALERRFQPVMVEEPSEEETVEILHGLRQAYEDHHHVTITDEALTAAVKLSSRYINDRYLPDKAIDVVDEAASKVRLAAFVTPPDIRGMEEEIARLETEKEEAIASEAYERAGEIKREQADIRQKCEEERRAWEQRRTESRPVVDEADVASVVSDWTRIPVQSLQEEEAARLLRLEETLHGRVIGQNDAVTAVAKAIRRGRVGLKDPKRPIGSFLFLGPTGVGKTELSKALAEALFGTENAMIRVDMSEYMEKHSVSKLIGSPPGYVGYDEGGQLSEKVRRNPYSILLFDEIEKAHPDVFNILLQVLDDGRITDSQGRRIDFKNTVIIMTSNVGASGIISKRTLGFGGTGGAQADYEQMRTRVMDEVKEMFRPEFLNRIDEVIVFHALGKAEVRQIVDLMLAEISRRAEDQMGIRITADEAACEVLMAKGYDEKFGARPMRRAIQSAIEDALAEKILRGEVKNGETVQISAKDGELTFTSLT